MKKIVFLLALVHVIAISAHAQVLGDILKAKAAEGAKQGAAIAAEKTADKVADKVLNKIFGGKKNSKGKTDPNANTNTNTNSGNVTKEVADTGKAPEVSSSQGSSLKTYSKFDFIAGEKILGYDDFEKEAIGDFPARWTTNASGEMVTVDAHPGKWLNVSKQGFIYQSLFSRCLIISLWSMMCCISIQQKEKAPTHQVWRCN